MKNTEKLEKLWEKYDKTKDSSLREELIIEYAPLVKIIAGRLKMYMGKNVEFEDLVSSGSLGLIDAIDKFDLTKNIKFETYASLRVRGSIIDSMRKKDWVPRSVRNKHKKLEAAYQKLEVELGRSPEDQEVADEMDMSLDEFNKMMKSARIKSLTSLEGFKENNYEANLSGFSSNSEDSPEKQIIDQDIKEMLIDKLKEIPERERKIIILYYYKELTLKEISEIIGVSESRISQLHTKTLLKLKGKLGKNKDILLGV